MQMQEQETTRNADIAESHRREQDAMSNREQRACLNDAVTPAVEEMEQMRLQVRQLRCEEVDASTRTIDQEFCNLKEEEIWKQRTDCASTTGGED